MTITLVSSLLLIALGLGGCSWVPRPSVPSFAWFKSNPQLDPTAEALFEEGNRYFNEKRYTRAIDAWQKLRTDHPFSPLVLQTELKIADAYYLNKQYPEAVTAFKEFQSLHPTNENIPFVLFRLGQSYLDQFSTTDREQKNTELARGYFESLITNYPKSPYAAEAKEKLAKTIEYLAESDFNIAYFYYQQEKYPAARDRFEEIVRKYSDTPTAAKGLFYLGESYKKEKNSLKAALAYEALLQHYPKSKFASEAKSQLAQLEQEKQDPLAMLLMRDRRPGPLNPAENSQELAKSERLKGLDLIQKTEFVYEQPEAEKGIFRRVVDKINPFGSSDNDKKETAREKTALELLAKKNGAAKSQSGGFLSRLNPFSGRSSNGQNGGKQEDNKSSGVVAQIDESLKQKGIDPASEQSALKPPEEALPAAEPAPQAADTEKLLAGIDSALRKEGKRADELPAPPEPAQGLRQPAPSGTATAKASAKREEPQSPMSSDLLNSIDQKLKSSGVDTTNLGNAPAPAQTPARQPEPKRVELEPKLRVEKGPLFLSPAETAAQEKVESGQEPARQETTPEVSENQQEPSRREIPRSVVRGPAQQPAPANKTTEQKKPAAPGEDEEKGVFDQLMEDAESVGKILNPFRW